MDVSMEKELPDVPEEFSENLIKYQVIVYYFSGEKVSDISKKVARGSSTCSKWIKKFKETGDVLKKIEKIGRPTVLTEEIKEFIYNKMKKDNTISLEKLTQKINDQFKIKIAKSTLSGHMSTIGSYKLPVNIPILSSKNKEKRLNYATYHSNDNFTNVIFSDESRFQICRNTKKVFVLKGDSQPTKFMPNPNYSVMVWGAISRKGKVSFAIVNETMNTDTYIQTLENYLIEPANKLHGKGKWRFQQDNAPCHKVYKIKRWFEDKGIRILDHPPQSPDLNPIENIWAIMKNEIEKENPKTKEELKELLMFYWKHLKNDVIENCIRHLIKTIDKVLNSGGNFITD